MHRDDSRRPGDRFVRAARLAGIQVVDSQFLSFDDVGQPPKYPGRPELKSSEFSCQPPHPNCTPDVIPGLPVLTALTRRL